MIEIINYVKDMLKNWTQKTEKEKGIFAFIVIFYLFIIILFFALFPKVFLYLFGAVALIWAFSGDAISDRMQQRNIDKIMNQNYFQNKALEVILTAFKKNADFLNIRKPETINDINPNYIRNQTFRVSVRKDKPNSSSDLTESEMRDLIQDEVKSFGNTTFVLLDIISVREDIFKKHYLAIEFSYQCVNVQIPFSKIMDSNFEMDSINDSDF